MDGPDSSMPRERSPPGNGEDHPAESSQTIYAGRYAVVRELGRGGMGRVLLARDPRIGRDVALKVLVPGNRDEKQLRRFEQEARAAGNLNHPNILTVFDVGEQGGEPYIVTELLTGTTLREALKDGPLEPARAVQLATDLAEGLVAAHEHGIVHRDLKP
ncbi:MAG: serine/threonine protein kinase, partial [Deltaproteobacteria bacterium]